MKKFLFLLCVLFFVSFRLDYSQTDTVYQEKARQKILSKTNTTELKKIGVEFEEKYKTNRASAIEWAKKNGYLIKGDGIELQGFQDGKPIYYKTNNRIAAKTVSTDKVQPGGSSGLNLTGAGITIGEWDEGSVYTSHSSFRETQSGPYHAFFLDSTGSTIKDHSTHVAGTIIANGNTNDARGMAEKATLNSWDWNHDVLEMTNAANPPSGGQPLLLSNHSYGIVTGWSWDSNGNMWYWYGDDFNSHDNNFGKYDSSAWNLDKLVFSAPYYNIVWAAGNDRSEGPAPFTSHYVMINGQWQTSTKSREKDGGSTGYNCISHQALGKNIITVGAIDDIPNGYMDTSNVKQVNASFSSWGPTLDGRIKPDIVANGDNLYSTVYHQNADPNAATGNYFSFMSGTSMAAPNLTGSLALLLQHYYNTHSHNYPLASTIKAIIIHTADEAGNTPGPDYKYGWGLLNTSKAAQVITLDQTKTNTIQELTLTNGQVYSLPGGVYNNGLEPLKVTIVWNDRPSTNPTSANILVNDLDLRITCNGQTYTPWILNSGNPSNPATTGDNTKDNVEQIFIAVPAAGTYTVTVSHKGTLSSSQTFSMIITGDSNPFTSVTIKQVDEVGKAFGQAAYWNSNAWEYVDTSESVAFGFGLQNFLSSNDYKPQTVQKFNIWSDYLSSSSYRSWDTVRIKPTTSKIKSQFISAKNATVLNALEGFPAVNSGYFFLHDPWLVDDNSDSKGIRNRGVNAQWVQIDSSISLSTSNSTYKGAFLNQNNSYDPNKPIYKLRAADQDMQVPNIGVRHFYFQGWSATGANLSSSTANETWPVFLNDGAVVQANYKGTQLSDSSNAFTNSSQRKVIRTSNNYLHMVYESMGAIWYEVSADGVTWQIANNGHPVSVQGKSPSIDYSLNGDVVIVWIEPDGISSKLMMDAFTTVGAPEGGANNPDPTALYLDCLYTNNINPVVAFDSENRLLVCWIIKNDLPYHANGIYCWYGTCYSASFNQLLLPPDPIISCSAENITISGNKNNLVWNTHNTFEFAWEGANIIHYCQLYENGSNTNIISRKSYVISNVAGFTQNFKPSITAVTEKDNGIDSSGARVTWVGIRTVGGGGEVENKINGRNNITSGTQEQKAVFMDPSHINLVWSFSNGVQNSVINKSPQCYSIAWSRSNTSAIQFTDSKTLSTITSLSIMGNNVQLSDGSDSSKMRAVSFKNATAPYSFYNKNLYTSIPQKIESNSIYCGREGIVRKDSCQFYFAVGDINVNNRNIDFIPIADTTRFQSLSDLNGYLVTNPIQVNDNSPIYYSVQYGVADPQAAIKVLNGNSFINFKVEVIDANTKEVLATSDNVTYDSVHTSQYDNISYQVNTEGIGNRTVVLRLKISTNAEIGYSLKNSYATEEVLQKSQNKHTVVKTLGPVSNYDLSQNYPNPFNPSTIIKYQIPKAGVVTMKVYDILGKEVASLVNGYQKEGRYDVKFDASKYASGVYIYQIKSNEYVSSKKMILIK